MSNFDVAIVMNQAALNGVLATFFAQPTLRSQVFSGHQQGEFAGIQVTVNWAVNAPPTVSLTPPSAQQWSAAIKQDGNTPQPTQNAFLVSFPALQVSQTTNTGESTPSTTAVEAIVTASINSSNQLALDPVAAIVDLSQASSFDQVVYKSIVIPQVLTMTKTMLAGQQIPNLSFQGVQFGAVVLGIGNGLIAGFANLSGRPVPSPALDALPNNGFYVLLSPDAMQQVANAGLQTYQGHSVSTSGDKSFGIGKAEYDASLKINSLAAQVSPSDLTTLRAAVDIAVAASAGLDLLSEIGGSIVSAGETVGGGIASAGETVGGGVVSAGKKIGDAFKSY